MALVTMDTVKDGHVAFTSGNRVLICSPYKSSNNEILEVPSPGNKHSNEQLKEPQEDCQGPPDSSNEVRILCATFSDCGEFFATADDAKQLCLWKCNSQPENMWQLVSVRTFVRKAIQIKFTHSNDNILAADRAGDLYVFSVSNPKLPCCLQLGHLSMLLDFVITPNDAFVITCDRDEKIRVSMYPNSYNINSFCLGHTEFVSTLTLLISQPDFLVSGSGDGTLRIWNYEEGKQVTLRKCSEDVGQYDMECIKTHELPVTSQLPSLKEVTVPRADGDTSNTASDSSQKMASDETSNTTIKLVRCSPLQNVLFVLIDKCCYGILYSLNLVDSTVKFHQTQFLKFCCEPWDASFDPQGNLWVLVPKKDHTVHLFQPSANEETLFEPVVESNSHLWQVVSDLNRKWKFFEPSLGIEKEFQYIYKHWFDNVTMYLEKKRKQEESVSIDEQKTRRQSKHIKSN